MKLTFSFMASPGYEQYRERLLVRQRELVSEIARLDADEDQVAEQTGSPDVGDRANRAYDKEALFQQIEQARDELTLVAEAMGRAADGSYGECAACGREIEQRRLEAVPWARYCLECQKKHDSGML